MERKEFLITLWNKYLKLLFLVGLIIYFIVFFYKVITQNSDERVIVFLLLGISLLITLVYSFKILFGFITHKIISNVPSPLKLWSHKLNKILNFISPIVFGAVLYYSWDNSYYSMFCIMCFFLVLIAYEKFNRKKSQ